MNFNTIQEKARQEISPTFTSFTATQEKTLIELEQIAIDNNMTFHEIAYSYIDNMKKLIDIYHSRKEQSIH